MFNGLRLEVKSRGDRSVLKLKHALDPNVLYWKEALLYGHKLYTTLGIIKLF